MLKNRMIAGALAAGAALLAIATSASADDKRIAYPKGYQESFTNYLNTERQNGKQLARFYANDVAMKGAESGEFPDGSIFIMEVYKAKADKDGKPVRSKNLKRLIRGDLAAVMVKQKGEGWGADYKGEGMDVGDWEFAGFKGDGSRLDKDFATCRSCHSEMKDSAFLFSYEHIVK